MPYSYKLQFQLYYSSSLRSGNLRGDLVQQEIGEQLVGAEELGTARAVALVAKMGDDAHVAEAVAACCEEGILYHLHANWAQQVPVHLCQSVLMCQTTHVTAA